MMPIGPPYAATAAIVSFIDDTSALMTLAAAVRCDNDAAARLSAGGVGRNAVEILESGMDDAALIRVHRLKRHGAMRLNDLHRHLAGQTLQAFRALLAKS